MKNIYSILIIALIGFSLFTGIATITSYKISKNELDTESVQIALKYDGQLADMQANFSALDLDSDFQPNQNEITDFFKEYYDHKTRVDQLIDAANLIYKLPDIMLNSIPFVDIDDLGFYRNTFWVLLIATVFIAWIIALRNGQMAGDNT